MKPAVEMSTLDLEMNSIGTIKIATIILNFSFVKRKLEINHVLEIRIGDRKYILLSN
jgi:hypothetical protein